MEPIKATSVELTDEQVAEAKKQEELQARIKAYTVDIQDKTNTLLLELISLINENKEKVLVPPEATAEDKMAIEEAMTDMSLAFIDTLSKSDLQWTQVSIIFKKFENILANMGRFVEGTLSQWDNEAVSRMYGVRDSVSDKFRKEEVTVGQLAMILKESREKTGGDVKDYIN